MTAEQDVRQKEPRDESAGPVVSVVVPVYNVKPYLGQCLDSVLGQSIGLDRLELIAVDDGSTDGSGELLDAYAAQHPAVRVIHEPNSGGPGRPRNVGMDHAAGTYVFFLDADDYLAPEAMERMVAMAQRNNSDIVVGKMVGVEGRLLPTAVFRRTRDRAELKDVYTLNVMKLFRRDLIRRTGVRFDETVSGGEDGPFTEELLLSAKVISVVADYDCYFCRDRPGSQTKRVRTESPEAYLRRMSHRAELLARHRPPGRNRERLMARHVRDMLRPFNRRWLALPPDERRQMFELGGKLLDRWSSPRIARRLSPPNTLRAYCLQHGLLTALEDIVGASAQSAFRNVTVERGRVFAQFPHFRDVLRIPDRCFEITRRTVLHRRVREVRLADGRLLISGEAYLSYLGGETTVVLQRWPWGREHRFATEVRRTPTLRDKLVRYPRAGFVADIDLSTAQAGGPLAPGPWKIHLAVGVPGLERKGPLNYSKRVMGAPAPAVAQPPAEDSSMRLYRARDGSFRLRVDGDAAVRTALEKAAARLNPVPPRRSRRLARQWQMLTNRMPTRRRTMPPDSSRH